MHTPLFPPCIHTTKWCLIRRPVNRPSWAPEKRSSEWTLPRCLLVMSLWIHGCLCCPALTLDSNVSSNDASWFTPVRHLQIGWEQLLELTERVQRQISICFFRSFWCFIHKNKTNKQQLPMLCQVKGASLWKRVNFTSATCSSAHFPPDRPCCDQ